jgi:hypothetical protein
MNTTANLKAVALNDEQTTCDLCGKMELRGTVIVADADNNEVGRYGTTCATKVLGEKVTRSQVKVIEQARRQAVTHLLLTARDNKAQRTYCLGQIDRHFVLVHADEIRLYNTVRAA